MSQPLRVLLIEDSEDDAALVLRALERGGYAPDPLRVQLPDALNEALDQHQWDLVISDHAMPGFTSLEALRIVHARGLDVPFIIVSGIIGEETIVEVMKAGAADFVLKNDLTRLPLAVGRELREAEQRAERRRMETALRRSEEQLRQAQKMEAIGRLAGGIAHDFNNLLTAIIGYSELLLADLPASDPHRRDVEEIKAAGDRAAGLTRQLLAFSRQQVLEPQVVDLNAVVTGMDQMLRRLLGEDVRLALELQPHLASIRADPGLMGQVLMNLVVNARDAMPEGGRLTIETSHADIDEDFSRTHAGVPAGAYVQMAVTDTGIGMDEATRARLFEPFFTTKPPGQGTGLGLSTLYGIVQQSGGHVSVYSEPGRGTTFRILLPRLSGGSGTPTAPLVQPAGASAGTETILLAEDEPAIRQIIVKVLAGGGYRVLQAGDGASALAIAQTHTDPIHLLITDVVMPDMNGPDLSVSVAEVHPEARVLFLSGYTDRAVINHGILEAGLAFLQKPFSPALLKRKVRQVLDGSNDPDE